MSYFPRREIIPSIVLLFLSGSRVFVDVIVVIIVVMVVILIKSVLYITLLQQFELLHTVTMIVGFNKALKRLPRFVTTRPRKPAVHALQARTMKVEASVRQHTTYTNPQSKRAVAILVALTFSAAVTLAYNAAMCGNINLHCESPTQSFDVCSHK